MKNGKGGIGGPEIDRRGALECIDLGRNTRQPAWPCRPSRLPKNLNV